MATLSRQPRKKRQPAPARAGRRSGAGKRHEGLGFLTRAKAVAALTDYFKAHPKTSGLTISIRGEKILVKPTSAMSKPAKARHMQVAPAAFFDRYYTPALAVEDNRFAAQSVQFDSMDFCE